MTLFIPCAIIAAVSVPLMFRLVPPNRVYGFRTTQTLASEDIWFRANRFAGFALFIASVVSACIFAARPDYASGRDFVGVAVLLVPLGIALAASFAYVRAIARGERR